jgi:hypothetical protein
MKTILALVATVLVTSTAAFANLEGTTVTGVLTPSGGGYLPGNYFDPAFLSVNYPSVAFVPSGSANVSSPTVTIGAGNTTIGYEDQYNTDTAVFNASSGTLTVVDVMDGSGALPWKMTFTDSAFTGLSTVSDNFWDGLGVSFASGMITLNWSGVYTFPSGPYTGTYTAVFDVSSTSTVPDNGFTVALLGLALAGLISIKRFKSFVC